MFHAAQACPREADTPSTERARGPGQIARSLCHLLTHQRFRCRRLRIVPWFLAALALCTTALSSRAGGRLGGCIRSGTTFTSCSANQAVPYTRVTWGELCNPCGSACIGHAYTDASGNWRSPVLP